MNLSHAITSSWTLAIAIKQIHIRWLLSDVIGLMRPWHVKTTPSSDYMCSLQIPLQANAKHCGKYTTLHLSGLHIVYLFVCLQARPVDPAPPCCCTWGVYINTGQNQQDHQLMTVWSGCVSLANSIQFTNLSQFHIFSYTVSEYDVNKCYPRNGQCDRACY